MMNGIGDGQVFRNERERELNELRMKGLAKTRATKLKDFSDPLVTPEQAEQFLATMRDKSKKEGWEHTAPSTLSTDGVDAWYMMQRKSEQELRKRRQEAESILRGYRAGADGDFGSPRARNTRASFGDALSESLTDPASPAAGKRRQSSMARLQNNWDSRDDSSNMGDRFDHHEGRQPFSSDRDPLNREFRSQSDRASFIDTSASQRRLDEKRRVSTDSKKSDDVPETIWRDFISDEPGAKFAPEAGRYHLYASYACPGSHRALIVRALKGLEDVLSVTIVHPTWRHTNMQNPDDKHRGWVFGDPNGEPFQNTTGRGGPFPPAYPGNDPDPILGAFSVRELYEYARDTSGKYTIPLLWDKKLNTIVNNESSDISYMLNSCFNHFSTCPELDLYTEDDEDGLDKLNEVSEWLYPMMIHGVYRCGFAKTQEAYDRAIDELTEAFDMADEMLREERYLTGDTLTDADIRLFVTLLRFDEVYAFYFRANTRLVMMTPSLLNFCREIYQMPGVAETCQMDQIKAHFFGSHAEWNKYSVIPRGLGFINLLQQPHDRNMIGR